MAKQSGTKQKYKRWNIQVEWNQGIEVATSIYQTAADVSY